ncbi:hypothetical protein GJ689_10790 [Rhodoplanes serenus]|uniref:Transmembrane protein n=1 Tax=Rhodoplanes serenus TaxID=200615 RepID=A0A327K4C6_9BRAD|nr:hypothetical protein [Rhodoplanes serenus]MBI5113309.1 hypothetical protein [Rhodovulum sp.]MTW16689.1 hypothetical protein [Rhodoplanes serenus]RAI32673.1 hypothetical protein CH340_14710 [Rhodoplanes serenus]VCU08022.1 hypothetical protein RHODGE_RHODGE_01158 [Rhodoplanes serenus]
MGKTSTTAIAIAAAAALALPALGTAPVAAAPAGDDTPLLGSGTVEASAQRRYYRGYRRAPIAPYAVGAAAATVIGIAAANSARRNSYYYGSPYGYYGGYAPYGYYGGGGYAPYGYGYGYRPGW